MTQTLENFHSLRASVSERMSKPDPGYFHLHHLESAYDGGNGASPGLQSGERVFKPAGKSLCELEGFRCYGKTLIRGVAPDF